MKFTKTDLTGTSIVKARGPALLLMEEARAFQKLEADSAWQAKAFPLSLSFQLCAQIGQICHGMDRADIHLALIHACADFLVGHYPAERRQQAMQILADGVIQTIEGA